VFNPHTLCTEQLCFLLQGGETKILPQLKPWLQKHKPNVLLSLHAFLFPDAKEVQEQIRAVIGLYKHPIWLSGSPVDVDKLNVASECYLCAMLLTDLEIDRSLLT
jgi:hypothetical protein